MKHLRIGLYARNITVMINGTPFLDLQSRCGKDLKDEIIFTTANLASNLFIDKTLDMKLQVLFCPRGQGSKNVRDIEYQEV